MPNESSHHITPLLLTFNALRDEPTRGFSDILHMVARARFVCQVSWDCKLRESVCVCVFLHKKKVTYTHLTYC